MFPFVLITFTTSERGQPLNKGQKLDFILSPHCPLLGGFTKDVLITNDESVYVLMSTTTITS